MSAIKNILVANALLFLAACSMQTEDPVFATTDGDFIGHEMKVLGIVDRGKPVEDGYFKVNPDADGSYIATNGGTEKYNDRYVLKAIKAVNDGIIYAVQIGRDPRPLLDGTISTPKFEIYPVKISNSGTITIYEFLKNKKAVGLARKYRLDISESYSWININGRINRKNAQCFVQDLVNAGLYKLLNDKKPLPINLAGYQPPKEIGIPDCE